MRGWRVEREGVARGVQGSAWLSSQKEIRGPLSPKSPKAPRFRV